MARLGSSTSSPPRIEGSIGAEVRAVTIQLISRWPQSAGLFGSRERSRGSQATMSASVISAIFAVSIQMRRMPIGQLALGKVNKSKILRVAATECLHPF